MLNPDREDTEWNDILRKHGIIPEKPKDDKIFNEIVEEAIAEKMKPKKMDKMNFKELNEIEDNICDDDEKFYLMYREQRMKELRSKTNRLIFTKVYEITKDTYVSEINQAPKDVNVVVHVYDDSIRACTTFNEYFKLLVEKYPHVKFVIGNSDSTIENYRKNNLPTLFFYKNGEMIDKSISLSNWHNTVPSFKDFEKFLSIKKVLKINLLSSQSSDSDYED
ncbi:Phosducin-like protein 2 [Intoshia linei]|uniref:Phosducin-like protein 2 n=1 Tax=Intoshia linei TaxID=1819745 RepID=A0A177B832_9BILA|nr:Phosducin-like protein 2 [Intoshia linei]